jgi:VWFA-related protein
MRKLLLVPVLLLAATVGGSSQQPTFQARADLVTVDVVVFDREGNPVPGLTRDDFTIREDGDPQAIAAFEAVAMNEAPATPQRGSRISTNAGRPDAAGRWFFVVFDDVNISQFSTVRARAAVASFIDKALRPGDRVMIVPASGGSNWIGELPQDREDLLAFVQRLQGERRLSTGADRILDHEAMGIALGRDVQAQAQVMRRYYENGLIADAPPTNIAELQISPGVAMVQAKARQTYTEARSRLQTTLGTLERLAQALADARGRKTLLLFTEGFIMDTTLQDFRTLLRAAQNANVAVHFVDVGNPGGDLGQPAGGADVARAVQENDTTIAMALAARETEGARGLAADTGGSTIAGTGLLGGLQRVANEGRTYYLLGYSPANARRDGRFRKIEVTVNRPAVTVRARGGYFAPSGERETPRDAGTLAPEVRAALDSPFGAPDIPLRLTSYALGPQVGGTVRTLLVAEADPAPLRLQPRDGRYAATLDSYVLVHDQTRGSLERNERVIELNVPAAAWPELARRGIPLQREFDLAPGHYQATVLVRDRATGTLGSVRHEFEVPPPREFRITTPIVTDMLQAAGAAGQLPRPIPVARRTFAAGSRIAAAFEVLGASEAGSDGPRVSVAYTLRRADGTEVAAAAPQILARNAAGQLAVAIGIALPAGAAGEHELHLSVRDEQAVRVIEHVEPLTLVP